MTFKYISVHLFVLSKVPCYIAQTGLKLKRAHLLQPQIRDYRGASLYLAPNILSKYLKR